MVDHRLRHFKDWLLRPVVPLVSRIHPLILTLVGLVAGFACGGAVLIGQPLWALGLWLLNRLLDGLDGLAARSQNRQSDLGGYLDLMADFIIYALLPLMAAGNTGTMEAWIWAATYLGTCYLNAAGWLTLSALLEKRNQGKVGQTSLTMPAGLMEGTESILLYGFLVTVPEWTIHILIIGTILVGISFIGRLFWGIKTLRKSAD